VSRPALEVADVFREHGPAWRQANAGHVSLEQLKVMSAIESCRTARLGGHVLRCEDCTHTLIAYNSCANRHCPKCQGATAREWLAAREADLLPVPYFHVVFSLPRRIADIAYQNKAIIYGILFRAAADTLLTIAADPEHLGAHIGITAVLHSWGSALTHHPHLHMIVPGGGFSLDGNRWVSCRPDFLLPVQVLSRLFRRLCLEQLLAAHNAGRLQFFRNHAALADRKAFLAYLAPLHDTEWVVYAKKPFGGPEQALRYMARYTHRVAIANSRLVAIDDEGVSFKWKDYRVEGPARIKVMTLAPNEFIRRFLIHVLPSGFHRIRHYGFLASSQRQQNIARARQLLDVPPPRPQPEPAEDAPPADSQASLRPCPCCRGRMFVIEVFARRRSPRYRATVPVRDIRIDTS
jgi:Putative transposase/Transposase zinc-binding domain